MRNLILVILAVILIVNIGESQIVIKQIPLKNATGKAYFQLANSAGDSTQTLGSYVDINLPITIGQISYNLRPDSIYILTHATADSTYSVLINTKYRTSDNGITTYSSKLLDSVYSTTLAIQRRAIKVTGSEFNSAVNGGFGIALLANAARNAVITATAAKVYVTLKCFYTLP